MEGMFAPMHLVVMLFVAVPMFMLGRLIWRAGSKRSTSKG